jgi:hypothetical protein
MHWARSSWPVLTRSATTIAAINFAGFGNPNVKGGCTKYASNASCSEKTFAAGWSHHCIGECGNHMLDVCIYTHTRVVPSAS